MSENNKKEDIQEIEILTAKPDNKPETIKTAEVNNTQNTSLEQPNKSQPTNEHKAKKSNKIIVIGMITTIVILLIIGLLVKPPLKKNSSKNNTKEENQVDNTASEKAEDTESTPELEIDENYLFRVVINDVVISFPCTKDSFKNTGWTWDSKYAKKDLEPGLTTTGGRIGKYPGGVVVTVINKTDKTMHIEDCTIDDGIFYNTGDNTENITFIGGLNYSSTIDEVKTKMQELGYQNHKEKSYENALYLNYYLDDNQSNYANYIEFYFYNNVIKSISINTAG